MNASCLLRLDNGAASFALLALLLGGLPGCGGKAASEEREAVADSTPPAGTSTMPSPPRPELPRPETCADNPLLAPCEDPPSTASCPENPLACPLVPEPPFSPPPPSRRSEDPSLPYVVRMEALLDEECGVCHGAEARNACSGLCEGMTYIDDMPSLLETGKIIPCDWRASPIGQRVRNGSMPPAASGLPPMPIRAQQQLEVFVENMCTELLYPENAALVGAQQLLLESCASCHGAPPADAGPPPGGLARIDDVASLIEGGFLVPCLSQASPIVLAIQNGSMPPPGSGVPPVSPQQLAALVAFVDKPCAR